jgi:hypothetical protein
LSLASGTEAPSAEYQGRLWVYLREGYTQPRHAHLAAHADLQEGGETLGFLRFGRPVRQVAVRKALGLYRAEGKALVRPAAEGVGAHSLTLSPPERVTSATVINTHDAKAYIEDREAEYAPIYAFIVELISTKHLNYEEILTSYPRLTVEWHPIIVNLINMRDEQGKIEAKAARAASRRRDPKK